MINLQEFEFVNNFPFEFNKENMEINLTEEQKEFGKELKILNICPLIYSLNPFLFKNLNNLQTLGISEWESPQGMADFLQNIFDTLSNQKFFESISKCYKLQILTILSECKFINVEKIFTNSFCNYDQLKDINLIYCFILEDFLKLFLIFL